MTSRAPIYLAGATGYIGREFIAAHASREFIVPIVRTMPRISAPPWCNAITMNELSALGTASTTGASLVHLIGCSRETSDNSIWRGNVGVTRRLLDCASALGVSRVVFVSGYGIGAPTTSVYYRAKHEAEQLISRSHLSVAILRCSYIVGGDDELTPSLIKQARAGLINVPGNGRFRIQPVHVADVIEILHRLATSAASVEGVFNLVGEAVSFAQFAEDIGSLANVDFELNRVDLEVLIKEAVTREDPRFSLSELGILCADQLGEPTKGLVDVPIAGYRQILRRLATKLGATSSVE